MLLIFFFNLVLDKAKESLEDRFVQLKNHNDLFGFFGRFQNMEKEELKKHAADLEIVLTDSKITQNDTSIDIVKEADLDGNTCMLVEEMEAQNLFYHQNISKIHLKCFNFYLKRTELRHFQTYLLPFEYI